MSSWEELQRADDLIYGLMEIDRGNQVADGFDVNMAVAQTGVRNIHYLWGVNQLGRESPIAVEHVASYPNGLVVQALQETVRVLTEDVGGYDKDQLLIMYGINNL